MAGLSISPAQLTELAGSLGAASRDLAALAGHLPGVAEAVGDTGLAGRVEQFQAQWRDMCAGLALELDSLAGALANAARTFKVVDDQARDAFAHGIASAGFDG